MKILKISGMEVFIDDEDYEKIAKRSWHLSGNYAVTAEYMHRFVLNYDGDLVVDHIDGNPLNNQKKNLRIVSESENQRNRKISKNNKTGIQGVCYHKVGKKWQAYHTVNGKQNNIGYFSSLERAKTALEIFKSTGIKTESDKSERYNKGLKEEKNKIERERFE